MEIRSYNEAPTVSGRTIEGRAVVFGKESKVLFDRNNKRFFVEIIEPGAINEDLLRTCDIKALTEHNRQRLLARNNRGVGSLGLKLDAEGLCYRFDAPKTSEGDYAVEMIERKDITGSSFAYHTDEKNVTYSKRDGIIIRRVHKIDRLFDVSIVADPAYTDTDVTVRSIDDALTSTEGEGENKDYLIEIDKLRKFI